MRWTTTQDAVLNRLVLAEDVKSKEITAISKTIKKTKDTKEKIRLLEKSKILLAEQSQLLSKIADRMAIIKSKIQNHEKKTAA